MRKNFSKVKRNLERLGYSVKEFNSSNDALLYLNDAIDNKSVGFGGSETVMQMGLFDALDKHNTTYSHNRLKDGVSQDETRRLAANADIYICSVNGLSENGEIINIDGRGNRVSSAIYGHEKIYFVIGENKLEEDFDKALYRARNIAAPKNAIRVKANTPCAVKMDKCYNCSSPDRICRALSVLWEKPTGANIEIILIHEDLGY